MGKSLSITDKEYILFVTFWDDLQPWPFRTPQFEIDAISNAMMTAHIEVVMSFPRQQPFRQRADACCDHRVSNAAPDSFLHHNTTAQTND